MSEIEQATSLRRWLEICQIIGLPAVPAIWGPEVLAADIFNAVDGVGEVASLREADAWLKQNFVPGSMWRWDCCAPLSLKSAMAHGQIVKASHLGCDLEVDDPRFIDILFDIGRASLPICVRPWVDATVEDGWPIEFRAYVLGSGAAVSNYYPQRPLSERWRAIAEEAGVKALALSRRADLESFTADFIVTAAGEMLFLEGGPSVPLGASPCCFALENLEPGAIALGLQYGSPYVGHRGMPAPVSG